MVDMAWGREEAAGRVILSTDSITTQNVSRYKLKMLLSFCLIGTEFEWEYELLTESSSLT